MIKEQYANNLNEELNAQHWTRKMDWPQARDDFREFVTQVERLVTVGYRAAINPTTGVVYTTPELGQLLIKVFQKTQQLGTVAFLYYFQDVKQRSVTPKQVVAHVFAQLATKREESGPHNPGSSWTIYDVSYSLDKAWVAPIVEDKSSNKVPAQEEDYADERKYPAHKTRTTNERERREYHKQQAAAADAMNFVTDTHGGIKSDNQGYSTSGSSSRTHSRNNSGQDNRRGNTQRPRFDDPAVIAERQKGNVITAPATKSMTSLLDPLRIAKPGYKLLTKFASDKLQSIQSGFFRSSNGNPVCTICAVVGYHYTADHDDKSKTPNQTLLRPIKNTDLVRWCDVCVVCQVVGHIGSKCPYYGLESPSFRGQRGN